MAKQDAATADDYANVEFGPIDFEGFTLEDSRNSYRERWTFLALALTIMGCDHNGCADIAAKLDDDMLKEAVEDLQAGKAYFQQAADFCYKSELRLMAGAQRAFAREDAADRQD